MLTLISLPSVAMIALALLSQADGLVVLQRVVPQRSQRAGAGPAMLAPDAKVSEDAAQSFEQRVKKFAPSEDLGEVRQQIAMARQSLENAVDGEDYVAAAMHRDDLRELIAKDPAEAAADVRKQLQEAVRRERYGEAAQWKDNLRVLRRFLPQYQLAGLWKGNYPNHGEELIRVRYVGDTMYATKVTGDEHVPAGEITFQAELATPFVETETQYSSGDGDELVGVRVEVVSLSSDGAPQQREVERYHGEGRIAARGFQHAHFVPGQLFLMDTDVLGFLWLPLGTLVVFNRVPEEEERRMEDGAAAVLPSLGTVAETVPAFDEPEDL